MTPPGLVGPECTLLEDGPQARVRVGLDVRRHRFLRDHLVAGRPLLSTVMGAEVVACAVALARPGVAVGGLRGLEVGPPFFLPAAGAADVEVTVAGGASPRCEVSSAGSGGGRTVHFSARLTASDEPAAPPVPGRRATPPATTASPVGADLVYGLFFHGPSFRVLAEATFGDGVMTGRSAVGLPAVTSPARRSLVAPLLVELCLQTAGLWELAALGTMTVPRGIDRVRRLSGADDLAAAPVTAVVVPRGDSVFDAVVLDDSGVTRLVVEGYRTTPFAHAYDQAAAARLREALTARR